MPKHDLLLLLRCCFVVTFDRQLYPLGKQTQPNHSHMLWLIFYTELSNVIR